MKDNAVLTLGKLIRHSDMTRKDVAHAAGLHYGTVCNWFCAGINPTADRWIACIEALGYEVKVEKKDGHG
jgi:hypothetical protein